MFPTDPPQYPPTTEESGFTHFLSAIGGFLIGAVVMTVFFSVYTLKKMALHKEAMRECRVVLKDTRATIAQNKRAIKECNQVMAKYNKIASECEAAVNSLQGLKTKVAPDHE